MMSAAAGVCFQFEKNGKCTYGKDCKFAHGPDDPKNKDVSAKHAAPGELPWKSVQAMPGAHPDIPATNSSTGGTGSPVKPKAPDRRADSPAAVDGNY